MFVEPRLRTVVDSLLPTGNAIKDGLKVGDNITAVNGTPVAYQDEIKPIIEANTGKEVLLSLVRNGQPMELTAHVGKDSLLGYVPNISQIKQVTTHYSFFQAMPIGANMAWNMFADNAKGIGKMVTGKVSARNISSPVGIAKVYGGTFDWTRFWTLTGLISIALAFMNLLPIPGLDGGHVVFLLIEMVQRKPVSEKVLEKAQIVGFVVLIGLMVFAFGNDILKAFGK